jgi:predicted HTH domain antitoxin
MIAGRKTVPQVLLNIPDDLLLALREQPEEFALTARLAMAIYYLREKRLSFGQAARLAGLTRPEFLDTLAAHGILAFDLSAADALTEVAAAQRSAAQDCQ